MNKKLIVIVIVALIIGGGIGTLISSDQASANFLDNFSVFFKKFSDRLPVATTTPSVIQPAVPYQAAIAYEEAVIMAVEVAEPSVVSIIVSKDLPIIERCLYDPFGDLPPEFRSFFNRGFGSEFYVPCEKGTERREIGGGSGFIVSADGLILTNKHVVLDTEAEYTVLTNDGEKYEATVLARDPVQDLAVLKIDSPNNSLPVIQLGDSDTIRLGQTAIAIGNTLGEFRNTVSVGVISGLARTITASGGGFTETIQGVIQTDAAINQGNSGGPLLNLKGEVIGINTAIVSGAQNIGFAIPINQAKRDIQSVKETGSIKIPYLGVRYFTLTPELAEEQDLSVEYGALIRRTDQGPAILVDSPAAKADLQAEDIILEVNGDKIGDGQFLGLLIQKYDIGDQITLKVQRGEEILTLRVTLEERPDL